MRGSRLVSAVTEVEDHEGSRARSCAAVELAIAFAAAAAERSTFSKGGDATADGILRTGAFVILLVSTSQANFRPPVRPKYRPSTNKSRARVAAT